MKQKSLFKNKNIYNPNCYINPKKYKRNFRGYIELFINKILLI